MDEFIKNHERILDGQKYLVLPSLEPATRFIVCFSSMGNKGYSRIKWFQDRQESKDIGFIFLFDELNQYYQGEARIELFKKIIFRTISEFSVSPKNCYCVGNSMGGTAAIYFATLLQLGGAIVSNPQTDVYTATTHSSPSWVDCMLKSGSFVSIEQLVCKVRKLPKLYIEYSSLLPDFLAAQKTLRIWTERGAVVVAVHNRHIGHESNTPQKHVILATIDYFQDLSE